MLIKLNQYYYSQNKMMMKLDLARNQTINTLTNFG